MQRNRFCAALAVSLWAAFPVAATPENRIDRIRPDAPTLAAYGEHAVGVRTLRLVNSDQVDLVSTLANGDSPTELARYDRTLVLEIWYPSEPGGEPTPYDVFLRDGKTEVVVHGQARRLATPDRTSAPYPLVLISHGYPGNRFLLSHLAENLASKGYVVAAIDHTDSTYRTRAAFASTLVHRPLDQLFVLDELAELSESDGFLSGLLDADRTGLIGYSMGGYGAVITAGGGVTDQAVERGAPLGALGVHRAGSEEHNQRFDDRIRAVVAFAPWGMEAGTWDEKGLAGMRIPTLFIAGSADDVSGYETGVRAIFEQAVGIDRSLLTFDNANHNAAAPMPAPDESYRTQDGSSPSFSHYADAVWDTVRMNNIAQHFVTAYLGHLLQNDETMEPFLDLVEDSHDGVWSVEEDGTRRAEHSYWHGFANRTAAGLRWEVLQAQP